MTLITNYTQFVFRSYVLISAHGVRTVFFSEKGRPVSFFSEVEAEQKAKELRTVGYQYARASTQKELVTMGGATMK